MKNLRRYTYKIANNSTAYDPKELIILTNDCLYPNDILA